MASEARPAGPVAPPFPSRPIHHLGFHVPDLRAAIDAWVTVYGAGPFYLLEHVAFDECTSRGAPASWDHSAGFGQCGLVPVELQQVHDLRPAELARPLTADGSSAVNHVGVVVDDAAAESARLESLGFVLNLHARLGGVDFFWHDATEVFGYSIEVITAGPDVDAFWDTVASGARDWDGLDAVRSL
jgi:catechol 2,3-dioxygenase-like lactoylglutathione lyase family enzyme